MMKRREFEELTRRYLDGTLNSRGFVLCPQPPPDHQDAQPRAIYEDTPEDHPALRARFGGEASRNDIEIIFEPARDQLRCELDGDDLAELLTDLGAPHQEGRLVDAPAGDLAGQFDTIDAALRHVLDTHPS